MLGLLVFGGEKRLGAGGTTGIIGIDVGITAPGEVAEVEAPADPRFIEFILREVLNAIIKAAFMFSIEVLELAFPGTSAPLDKAVAASAREVISLNSGCLT